MALLLACLLIILAFGLFFERLPKNPVTTIEKTDALVVVTGGPARIEAGLDLLAEGAAPRLFISGAGEGVSVADIIKRRGTDALALACCIELGHEASDTIGNAVEVARWARANGIHDIRLVTTWWHMPRTAMLIARAAPDLTVRQHPVFPEEGHARLAGFLMLEFPKYWISWLMSGPDRQQ